MQETTRNRIKADVSRRLLQHLNERKDVQNIDLMNPAGFRHNCRAKWYVAAAENDGASIDLDRIREIIYGVPYTEQKRLHQKKATAERLQAFAESGQGPGKPDA